MRIFIIGGTGYIGSPAAMRLGEAGHEVAVFHRGETCSRFPQAVNNILGDRRQLADFGKEFEQFAPQVVLDMMPYFEEDAVSVMQAFRGIAQRVVAISSHDVYRSYGILWRRENTEPNITPIGEDAPLRTVLYPYRPLAEGPQDRKFNYDKIPAERVFMSEPEDLPGTILRLPATYGVGDHKHRWFDVIKRMDDHRPFYLMDNDNAKWRWTRGYIENVADAIALAVTDPRTANRIYNIGDPDVITEKEWVQSIADIVGWKGEIIAVPNESLPKHLKSDTCFDHDLFVDTSRFRSDLGYSEKVARHEALVETIEWERANPPAEIDPHQFDYAAEDAAFEALN